MSRGDKINNIKCRFGLLAENASDTLPDVGYGKKREWQSRTERVVGSSQTN